MGCNYRYHSKVQGGLGKIRTSESMDEVAILRNRKINKKKNFLFFYSLALNSRNLLKLQVELKIMLMHLGTQYVGAFEVLSCYSKFYSKSID